MTDDIRYTCTEPAELCSKACETWIVRFDGDRQSGGGCVMNIVVVVVVVDV